MWRPWETPAKLSEIEDISTTRILRRSRFLTIDEKKQFIDIYFNTVSTEGLQGCLSKAATRFGICYTTAYKIIHEGVERKVRRDKGTFRAISEFEAEMIHQAIAELIQQKLSPSFASIFKDLTDKGIIQCKETTLRRFFRLNGYRCRLDRIVKETLFVKNENKVSSKKTKIYNKF